MILKYLDIPENSGIIDIGTGAGFPALPLSVMRDDLKITFLDGSNKKINFIKNFKNFAGNKILLFYAAGLKFSAGI
jgi:16S rRNA G527 N7-methylase RsmG